MKSKIKALQSFKAMGVIAALFAIVLAGMLNGSPPPAAEDSEAALVARGLDIAPVPLNLAGRNIELVGLGSYLVNARSDCNSCHTAGDPPNFDYANGSNPYFGQPSKVDPTTYMGGGQDFGPAGLDPKNPGPDIISRNLTPDKTGKPEGGHTLSEFKQILKTGVDFDHLHPTCSGPIQVAGCIPAPVDGALLQIMPWPTFAKMTEHDMDAIYEYLSAIPCFAGPPAPSPLHNDCQ